MKFIQSLLVIITLCWVSYASYEVASLAHDARTALPPLLQSANTTLSSVEGIELNTVRAETELAGTFNIARHVLITEQKAQQAQLERINLVSDQLTQVLMDVDASAKDFGGVSSHLSTTLDSTNMVMVDASHAIEVAATDLADPSIKKSLASVASSAAHTDAITANIEGTSQDVKDYVHRETTPVRGTWNTIKGLIDLIWSIRGAAGI